MNLCFVPRDDLGNRHLSRDGSSNEVTGRPVSGDLVQHGDFARFKNFNAEQSPFMIVIGKSLPFRYFLDFHGFPNANSKVNRKDDPSFLVYIYINFEIKFWFHFMSSELR